MASAFLSQALREQATQEARGQMMKKSISERVASQLMGQLAQGEINADMRRDMGKGKALNVAAGQEMRRDVGRTQFEMQKSQAAKAKKLSIVTAIASSVGALTAMVAKEEEDKGKEEALALGSSPSSGEGLSRTLDIRDQVVEDSLMYGGATGGNVISQMQAQDDALGYGAPSGQELQTREDALMYGGTTGLAVSPEEPGEVATQEGAEAVALDEMGNEVDAEGNIVTSASSVEELIQLIKKRDEEREQLSSLSSMPTMTAGGL